MPREAPKIQTKYDRLEYMLIEQYSLYNEFESQLQDTVDDFTKWVQKNLPDISTLNSKKGRKRNIEAILEKNEECESPVESNSSEAENTRRKLCSEENIVQNDKTVDNNATITNGNDEGKRVKRTASKIAEQMILKHSNVNLNQKLRRPDNVTKFEVQIKAEKLSLLPSNDKAQDERKDEFAVPKDVPRGRQKKITKYDVPNRNNDLLNVVIKQEKEDDDDKRTTRKPRSQITSKNKTHRDRSKQRASNQTDDDDDDDIKIEMPQGVVLTVSDSEDEIENNIKNKPKAKKKSVVDKSVNESSEKTEVKSANETGNEQSVYEDAQDQVLPAAAASPTVIQGCFVRLENISNHDANLTYDVGNESKMGVSEPENENRVSHVVHKEQNVVLNNTIVLHKEEADGHHFVSPLKALNDNTFNTKDRDPVFGNKNVKESNNAEKSQPITSQPQRITRTKQKAMDAAAAAAVHTVEGKENICKKDGASKTKSNSKLNNIVSTMESFIPKTGSTVKLLKSELREKREEDTRKKLEKEDEVQKKKEAMIQAKVEEQKKKREEKALRAQQIREQIEKERQMQAEKQEREKQEKLKQIQMEREAYKKEIARKRALADKRAQENEERRRAEVSRQQRAQQDQEEVERRLEAQRKRDQEENEKKRLQEEYEQAKAKARAQKLAASKSKQLVKTKKGDEATPMAKSNTVFDLDTDAESEDEENPKRPVPVWSKLPYRVHALEKQSQIPDKIVCTLFGSKPTCIDLRAIFPNIIESRMRRQSSAVWNTPPRYSLMPKEY